MNASLWFDRRVVVCFALMVSGFFSAASSALDLESLAASLQQFGAVRMTGTMTKQFGGRGDENLISKRLAYIRRQWETSLPETDSPFYELRKADMERMITKVEKGLRNGSVENYKFSLLFCSNGILAYLEGPRYPNEPPRREDLVSRRWILQEGGTVYDLQENKPASIRVYTQPLEVSSAIGDILFHLGSLGSLKRRLLVSKVDKNVRDFKGGLEANEVDFGDFKITNGEAGRVVREDRVGVDSDPNYKEAFEYTGTKKVGGIIAPEKVVHRILSNNYDLGVTVELESLTIEEVDKAALPKFSTVAVSDARVEPPFEYDANGRLLTPEEIVNFLADPAAFKLFQDGLKR